MGSKVLWVHFAGETSETEVVEFERPINLASPSLDVFWFCGRMTFPSALINSTPCSRGGGYHLLLSGYRLLLPWVYSLGMFCTFLDARDSL